MSVSHEFYLARVAEAEAGAKAALLDNVRDRWLRSAERWAELATRTKSRETTHSTLLAEKATERAAREARKAEDTAEAAARRSPLSFPAHQRTPQPETSRVDQAPAPLPDNQGQ